MGRIAFTLICLASTVALATTVYKWIDENGVVHYSDQPHANAQKLQVQGVQTYSAGASSLPAAGAAPESRPASANPYQGCVIAQPLNEQNLPNAQSVFVRVQTDPLPRQGDRIYMVMDGQALNGGNATGMSFNVTPIERGAHTVQAQVKDSTGQVLCQTPPVTFYVHQPNLLSPGPPKVNPH